MKLHYLPASPFSRKVLITAIECGLDDRIEIVNTNPYVSEPQFVALNPFSKIPTLVLDNGTVIYESLLICEYLDELAGGARVLPRQRAERIEVLRKHAVGNGIMEAAVLRRMESLRAREADRDRNMQRQHTIVERALDRLEPIVETYGESVDLGNIAIAVALAYLDLRFAADAWRDRRPNLTEWCRRFAARKSFTTTTPF